MHTVYKSISSCSGPVGTPMLFTSVNAIVRVNQPTRVLANGRRMATSRAAGVGARAAVQLPIYTPSNRVDEPTRQEALAQVDNALHTTILVCHEKQFELEQRIRSADSCANYWAIFQSRLASALLKTVCTYPNCHVLWLDITLNSMPRPQPLCKNVLPLKGYV